MSLLMMTKNPLPKQTKYEIWSMMRSWSTKYIVYCWVLSVVTQVLFLIINSHYFIVCLINGLRNVLSIRRLINRPRTHFLKLWIIIMALQSSTVKICLARWLGWGVWGGGGCGGWSLKNIYQNVKKDICKTLSIPNYPHKQFKSYNQQ